MLPPTLEPDQLILVRLRISSNNACLSTRSDSNAGSGGTKELYIEYDCRRASISDRSVIVDKIREKGAETTAEWITAKLDSTSASEKVWQTWKVNDVGGFAQNAEDVSKLRDSLHKVLLGDPTEKAFSSLHLPGSDQAGFFAEQISIDPADQILGQAKRGIEIVGMAVGVLSGNPLMACACFKAWIHDEVHHMIVAGVKSAITGDYNKLFDGEASRVTSPRYRTEPIPGTGRRTTAVPSPGTGRRTTAVPSPGTGRRTTAVPSPGTGRRTTAVPSPGTGRRTTAVPSPGTGRRTTAVPSPGTGRRTTAVPSPGTGRRTTAVPSPGTGRRTTGDIGRGFR